MAKVITLITSTPSSEIIKVNQRKLESALKVYQPHMCVDYDSIMLF
jgi:hypothetical protein